MNHQIKFERRTHLTLASLAVLLLLAFLPISNATAQSFNITIMTGVNDSAIATFRRNLQAPLRTHRGRFMTDAIRTGRQLRNPGTPSVEVRFPGDAMVLLQFPNSSARSRFFSDGRVSSAMRRLNSASRRVVNVRARPGTGGIAGTIAEGLGIGLRPISQGGLRNNGSTFLLLNPLSINTRSFFARASFESYSLATPALAMTQGTRFFTPFVVESAQGGSFPFQQFVITEWASENTFFRFHRSRPFRALVPLRNRALTRFSDTSARTRRL